MERVILHSDLNSFYANVEILHHPQYRDKPLVVCGNVDKRHGIVLAKSEEAKKYNIKTGDTLWQAYKKCPQLIAIEAGFSNYIRFSKMVRAIYEDYTDKIESFGIDECWLDVSESVKLFGSGEKIADAIRERIIMECGISASIGVSYNKIYAKLGSDLRKPNYTNVISRENRDLVVYPLPVEDLLYVGRASASKLKAYGILTIGDLANANEMFILKLLGKMGAVIQCFARGEDKSEVMFSSQQSKVKSVGNSLTPPRDLVDLKDVKMLSYLLAESVASRLRDHQMYGDVICVSMRNNKLEHWSRQRKLNHKTDVSSVIANTAISIILKEYDFKIPLRSMGISVSGLSTNQNEMQLSIFEDLLLEEKQRRAEITIDDIRRRFGHHSIKRGIMLCDESLVACNPKIDNTIGPISYFK